MIVPMNSNDAAELGISIRGNVKKISAWVALRFLWEEESKKLFLNPRTEDEGIVIATRAQLAREVVEAAIK